MAITVDPITGKISFGAVGDNTNDSIAIDLASQFGVSEDFKENFTLGPADITDTFTLDNFTDDGTDISVNTGTEKLDFTYNGDGTQSATARNITPVSDSKFVFRFKLDLTTLTQGTDPSSSRIHVVLSSEDETVYNTQNYLGFSIRIVNTDIQLNYVHGTAVLRNDNGTELIGPVTTGVRFCELKRTSPTTAIFNVFSDADFSTLIVSSGEVTISSSITDLDHIKVQNGITDGTEDHTITGTVDDMQLYDGVTPLLWTSSTSGVYAINEANENIDYTTMNATNDTIVYDLGAGNVDDTWTLRFKMRFTTLTAGVATNGFFGMSDSDETEGGGALQNHIMIRVNNTTDGGGTFGYAGIDAVNNQPNLIANNDFETFVWSEGTDYYFELVRTSTTTYTVKVFTDSEYSSLVSAGSTSAGSIDVTGLRYIKFTGVNSGGGGGEMTGTIDDVQFWNTKTVPTISSANWRARFKYELTDVNDSGSAVNVGLFIGLGDKDATAGSATLQDGFYLLTTADNGIDTEFRVQTPDNSIPENTVDDASFATIPSVATRFIELKRDSASQTTVSIFSDSTFTTLTESETSAGISGTDNLKYFKLFNAENQTTPNTLDGSVDDLTFTDLSQVAAIPTETFTVDALLQVLGDNGCFSTFQDNFSTALNWVQTGSNVTITGGEISGWGADSTDQRLTHDLTTPLSDDKWKVEFEYQFTASTNPSHFPIALSDKNQDILATSDNDAIAVTHGTTVDELAIRYVDNGDFNGGSQVQTSGIPISSSTTYFVRLERETATQVKLSVFSDSGFTTHIASSPIIESSFPSTIDGLQYVHSQNSSGGGAGRTLTGTLDNLVINGGCPTFTVDAFLKALGDNGCSTGFQDDFATSVNWVQTGTGVTITGGEISGWSFDGTDRRLTHDLGTPLNDVRWIAECDYQFTASSNPAHAPLILTDINQDADAGTNDNDFIAMIHGTSVNELKIIAGDSDDLGGAGFGSTGIPISTSTPYFPRLERLTSTLVRLSVYSDSARTTHIASSPVTLTIPSTIDGLQFVHSQNLSGGGAGRTLTGTLDNLSINNCPSFSVDAIIKALGDSGCSTGFQDDFLRTGDFEDSFVTATNWTTSNSSFLDVNTGNQELDYLVDQTVAQGEAIFHDLGVGNVSDTLWTLRFKFDITNLDASDNTNALEWFFGLSDTTGGGDASQSWIAMYLFQRSTLNEWGTHDGLSSIPDNTSGDSDVSDAPSSGTFFCEIKRTSSTAYTVTVYNNSDFTGVNWTDNATVSASVTGLRYIKCFTSNDGVSTGLNTLSGTIDEVEFWDGDSNSTNWVQTGTGVSIIDGEISGWGLDSVDRRLTHDLGSTLSDSQWQAEFEYMFTASNIPAHMPLVISDINQDVFANTDNDAIGVNHSDTSTNSLVIRAVDNGGLGGGSSITSSDIPVVTSTQYFVRLERLSSTETKLSVFSDASFTTHIASSPVTLTIPSTIDGLQYVHSQNISIGGGTRSLTGTLDNLDINNCPSFTVDAILEQIIAVVDKDFTVNGILILVNTETFSVDTFSQASQTEVFIVDSILQATFTETFQVDTFSQASQTETFSIDAFLQATQTEVFTTDSILKATFTETFLVDSFLQALGQVFNFTIDGLLFITPSFLICVDALLQETFAEDLEVDAIVVNRFDETFLVDGRLIVRNTETFLIDALLQATFTETFLVDARLIIRQTQGFTVDAFIQARPQVPFEYEVDSKLNRQVQFVVDVSVTPDTAVLRDIGDLIVRVLFEDVDLGGNGLTGNEIVDNIVAITTVELQWGFRGKVSRIKNWIGFLERTGVIQEDNSDPDWYETVWTLVNPSNPP